MATSCQKTEKKYVYFDKSDGYPWLMVDEEMKQDLVKYGRRGLKDSIQGINFTPKAEIIIFCLHNFL